MADETPTANPLFSKHLVYQQPYAGDVREGIHYGSATQVLDIYLPELDEGLAPVVVLVTGYADPGFESLTGIKQMQIQSYKDWAKLLAANGMAAVIYSNIEPVADARALVDFLRLEAAQLQIDPQRIAIWACSGNVPNALHLAHGDAALRCAVLLYGFMLDTKDSAGVAEAATTFRFSNPNKAMESFPENTPILIIGAGQDEFPGLNESIDNFEAQAIAGDNPVSVIRYPQGVHGFDILDDSQRSIEMIKLCVGFLRLRLNVY
ncbi:MAG: alpha/beta hydrolase [Pseudohongiellaceae bacterium]